MGLVAVSTADARPYGEGVGDRMRERKRLIIRVDTLRALAQAGIDAHGTDIPSQLLQALCHAADEAAIELRGHIIKTTDEEEPASITRGLNE